MILSHLAVLPILVPVTGAAIGILLRNYRDIQGAWTFGAMLTSFFFSVALLYEVWTTGEAITFQVGGWDAPFGITIVADMLSATMVVMSQAVLAGGILYGLGCTDKCARYPMFNPIFLTLATGLTGAMLTGDIFNMFVFVELLVLSGAVLTAISDDQFGPEAAYKYFYISLFAAIFMLIGIGSLYISYGTLNMAQLAALIAANPDMPLLPIAIATLTATFMIKSAVVPFHFWQPDFHTAAPTPVHAVLSSVVVKVGIYGFFRMTTLLFLDQAATIQTILLVMGAFGIVFGGLGAVGTYDAKRMLAYSTLGQLGFILVGIGWGTPLALAAAVIYAFNHSLIKSAMLMLAGSVASRAAVKTAAFSTIQGMGKEMPFAGILFLLGGLALAGIPPTNGFVSKLTLFRSGIEAEAFLSLAFIGFASLITVVYVGRAFQRIWWEPKMPDIKMKPAGDRLVAPTILIAFCLVLGLWGEPLIQLADVTTAWMLDPMNYIEAVLGVDAVAGIR
jgi:multicomponent Na+:H+ antiporter subunit D